ncbi:hypothetical protein HY612_05780 [Candidatus Roizmanbacteria bacterium]|nr:hypothetical protein [Candidatus Roizmanbacteria bacterium]
MPNWKNSFSNQSFFYITPDVKRGLGLENILPHFHIICSYFDPLIPVLRKQNANIFCLEEIDQNQKEVFNNSGKLLENPHVNNYIAKNSRGGTNVLLFKPSVKTELICEEMAYRLLVNSSHLNRKYENKISFHELVAENFPQNAVPAVIGYLKNFRFGILVRQFGLPFIIQFSLGWAGKTTFLIREENEFNELINRFPDTPVKISKYIKGFTILNNACIYNGRILISPPAYQLSGFKELSSSPFVTCGRQWPAEFLANESRKLIFDLTNQVGKIMAIDGYKGYFGLDFIIDEESGKVYISENNARFTASSAFWTKMEIGRSITPLMAYHIAHFTGVDLGLNYLNDGDICASQVIFRDKNIQPKNLEEVGFGVFTHFDNKWKLTKSEYKPEKLGTDEIIFMKRAQIISDDGEISRVETKKEVVQTTDKLQDWVRELL